MWKTFGVPVFEYLLDEQRSNPSSRVRGARGAALRAASEFLEFGDHRRELPVRAPGSRLAMELDAIIVENEPDADVAKLADAPDLGSGSGNRV